MSKILQIKTASGAVYEVDMVERRVRRKGNSGTLRAVPEWKPFESVRIDKRVQILWPVGEPLIDGVPSTETNRALTISSPIVEVSDVP